MFLKKKKKEKEKQFDCMPREIIQTFGLDFNAENRMSSQLFFGKRDPVKMINDHRG